MIEKLIQSIQSVGMPKSDYNTYDFTNHTDVYNYLEHYKTPNWDAYKNIRAHLKIFSFWLEKNNYLPVKDWNVTSFKSILKTPHLKPDHKAGSPSHDGGYAIDISCSRLWQIYAFAIYLHSISKINNMYGIYISLHNYHIHVDTRQSMRGIFRVEKKDMAGNYVQPFPEFETQKDELKKWYKVLPEHDWLISHMWKDFKPTDLLPTFNFKWLFLFLIIPILFLFKRR